MKIFCFDRRYKKEESEEVQARVEYTPHLSQIGERATFTSVYVIHLCYSTVTT